MSNPKLNPNAKPFSFNPSASSFSPKPKLPADGAASPLSPPATTTTAAATTSWEDDPSPGTIAAAEADSKGNTAVVVPTPAPTSVAVASPPAPTAATASATPPPQQQQPSAATAKAPATASPVVVTEASDKQPAQASAAAPAPTQKQAAPAARAPPQPSSKKEKEKVELKAHDDREPLNIVFIGHVDAGKSTIAGSILLQTGHVDERTIAKYQREAKEKNRENWYIAYIMDTSEEERAKGKTVEVGRAHFATATKRYTLLDAPGHKSYVPNMIGGAAQADVGVLVISARRGEFETGFERGGQTREHALLAKTLGISRLIVAVNKMDDCQWARERFDEIERKLSPYLKKWGYNIKTDVVYCPIEGFSAVNIKEPVPKTKAPWYYEQGYAGKALLTILDEVPKVERNTKGAVRIPILTRYKDMGAVYVLGKVEAGYITKGMSLLMEPTGVGMDLASIQVSDETEVTYARAGENVCLKVMKGIDEEDIHTGYVLGPPDAPPSKTAVFEAQVFVLELLAHRPIITKGYECVLHVHSLSVECIISRLISDDSKEPAAKASKPATADGADAAAAAAAGADSAAAKKKKKPKRPKFIKNGVTATIRIETADRQSIAIELFAHYPALGRFTLRDEGQTIAVGKVTRLVKLKKKKAVMVGGGGGGTISVAASSSLSAAASSAAASSSDGAAVFDEA